MKIFIIHKGMDIDYAFLFKKELEQNTGSEVLVLENTNKFWKLEAAKLIKKAQLVLFVVGPEAYKSPYIGWELKHAIKKNKQIFCLNLAKYESIRGEIEGYRNDTDPVQKEKAKRYRELEQRADQISAEPFPDHDALKYNNRFTKEFVLSSQVKKAFRLSDVEDAIQRFNNGEYDIFNKAFDDMNEAQLLEQNKIYLNTSETLVARRQSVNNFYISVNAAMITVSSAVTALVNSSDAKLIVICCVALMGILLDISWIKLLEAYGILNSSKMKIIRLIERRLPVSLYDKEWDVMSDKLNSRKYISFTDSEKRIPKLFMIIYGLMLLFLIVYLILKFAFHITLF